ncbi:MAG: S8 family serine peptidase [Microthrixaceae bacterium]
MSLTCPLAPSTASFEEYSPDGLSGPELDVTAFVAGIEALTGTGMVDITTEEDGKPGFESVPVWELGATLDAEPDPVIAVEASELVSITEVHNADASSTGGDGATEDPTVSAVTNDPLIGDQWSNEKVPYTTVWQCGRGAGIDIAVLDTGVDRTHPDLAGHTTTGGSSLGGQGSVVPGGGGTDPHGHGTHVAGIAAATADNSTGIAGVAPDATIIPVRVLDASGSGFNVDVAAGITWAADAGAEVINLSLGGPNQAASVANAIAYATSKGVVVVAAAGNGGVNGAPQYPGADNRTIAVASVDSNLAVSTFSTRGNYVDIAAPGGSILSTVPGALYTTKSGTSMATPFISGVVALTLGTHPTLNPDQVRQRIMDTARETGPIGHDPAYGAGIVDLVGSVGT